MNDYQAALEKLRTDAADAALIRDLATDRVKREVFDRLAKHLGQLADDVERAMSEPKDKPSRGDQDPASRRGIRQRSAGAYQATRQAQLS